MNTNEFYQAVADLCNVKLTDVTASVHEGVQAGRHMVDVILHDWILPGAVQVGGQDTRGWRISPRFMDFMAEWGYEIINKNLDCGALLYELALQRISKGALLHEGVHLINILPPKYQKYSAAYDQPGLMDKECWAFLTKQLEHCLALYGEYAHYGEHARKILFGMFEHFSPSGKTDVLWDDDIAGVTPKDVWAFATERVQALAWANDDEALMALSHKWREHKDFFKELVDRRGPSVALFFVPLEDEQYFTGTTRWMYKKLGWYAKKTQEHILKELTA